METKKLIINSLNVIGLVVLIFMCIHQSVRNGDTSVFTATITIMQYIHVNKILNKYNDAN